MKFLFGIIGLVGSFFILRFREYIGDMIGDADWMRYVGGPYNLVVLIALFIFFWSIAAMTGTEDVFVRPILWLFPGGRGGQAVDAF